MPNHHPVARLIGFAAKNIVGVILLAVGIAQLFLPGQGIVTILLSLSLLDFPGKRALERKIVGRPMVLRAINALRAKHGRAPLTVGDGEPKDETGQR